MLLKIKPAFEFPSHGRIAIFRPLSNAPEYFTKIQNPVQTPPSPPLIFTFCIMNAASKDCLFHRGLGITESWLLISGCLQASNLCYKLPLLKKIKKDKWIKLVQASVTS